MPTTHHQVFIIEPITRMITQYNQAAGRAFEKGDDAIAHKLRDEAIRLTTLLVNIKTELPMPVAGTR